MKYIKGFDGLRCYSILLVVITHLGVANYFKEDSYLREHVFYFFSGSAGVNIFFAISGFLITNLILYEIREKGEFNLKFFFLRRFIRLLPPVIPFYLALLLFMKMGYVRDTTIGLFASALYIFNFVPKAKVIFSSELSHTWSLAVEEQFYIIWAFSFKFLNERKRFILIFFCLALSIVAFYVLPLLEIQIKEEQYTLEKVFFIKRWTIPAISPILLGALFAKLNFNNYKNIRNRFFGLKPGFISFIIFLSPFYLPNILMPLVKIFHGLGATLILLWIYNNQNRIIIGILEWFPIKYIGVISYGIYIWQGFFLRTGPNVTPKIWLHEFPFNIFLTFVVAILSYELFEKKILRLKNNYKTTTTNNS